MPSSFKEWALAHSKVKKASKVKRLGPLSDMISQHVDTSQLPEVESIEDADAEELDEGGTVPDMEESFELTEDGLSEEQRERLAATLAAGDFSEILKDRVTTLPSTGTVNGHISRRYPEKTLTLDRTVTKVGDVGFTDGVNPQSSKALQKVSKRLPVELISWHKHDSKLRIQNYKNDAADVGGTAAVLAIDIAALETANFSDTYRPSFTSSLGEQGNHPMILDSVSQLSLENAEEEHNNVACQEPPIVLDSASQPGTTEDDGKQNTAMSHDSISSLEELGATVHAELFQEVRHMGVNVFRSVDGAREQVKDAFVETSLKWNSGTMKTVANTGKISAHKAYLNKTAQYWRVWDDDMEILGCASMKDKVKAALRAERGSKGIMRDRRKNELSNEKKHIVYSLAEHFDLPVQETLKIVTHEKVERVRRPNPDGASASGSSIDQAPRFAPMMTEAAKNRHSVTNTFFDKQSQNRLATPSFYWTEKHGGLGNTACVDFAARETDPNNIGGLVANKKSFSMGTAKPFKAATSETSNCEIVDLSEQNRRDVGTAFGTDRRFKYPNFKIDGDAPPPKKSSGPPRTDQGFSFGTEERGKTEVQIGTEDEPGPGAYSVPRMFEEKKKNQMRSVNVTKRSGTKTLDRYTGQTKSSQRLNTELPIHRMMSGVFGFGCSYHEHALYGACLDGLCGRRAHYEQTLLVCDDRSRWTGETDISLVVKSMTPVHSSSERDDSNRLTPLQIAVAKSDLDAIKTLSTLGYDVNECNKNVNQGKTAIHMGANLNSVEAVQLLVDIYLYDKFGTATGPLLSRAESAPDKKFVSNDESQRLRHNPPPSDSMRLNVNCMDVEGNTPLHLACDEGYEGMVALLVDSGADPVYCKNSSGKYPFEQVRTHACFQILRMHMQRLGLMEELKTMRIKQQIPIPLAEKLAPVEDLASLGNDSLSVDERFPTSHWPRPPVENNEADFEYDFSPKKTKKWKDLLQNEPKNKPRSVRRLDKIDRFSAMHESSKGNDFGHSRNLDALTPLDLPMGKATKSPSPDRSIGSQVGNDANDSMTAFRALADDLMGGELKIKYGAHNAEKWVADTSLFSGSAETTSIRDAIGPNTKRR
jgi:hypothetical protein